MINRQLFLACILLAVINSVPADDRDDGRTCGQGKGAASFQACSRLAQKGDKAAQYWLGQKYRLGEGVDEDKLQSISWYRKSAEQGHAFAQYWTGRLLTNPDLDRSIRNEEEGVKWLKLAAQQNIVSANVLLGAQYEKGLGAPQDYAIAYSYFLKAAQAGDPLGMYAVGIWLNDGKGVSKDSAKAFEWLNKAVKLDLSDENKSTAFYNMANMFLYGIGVERNHQNALNMLRKAAASGRLESKEFLDFIDNQAKYSAIDPRSLVDMSKSDERYLDAVGLINKNASGFLISKCHVLTARHSVFGSPFDFTSQKQYPVEMERLKKVSFDVGQMEVPPYKKIESTGVVIDFVEFKFKEFKALGWKPIFNPPADDWALIKLNKLSDGTYSGDKIKPFCFYRNESELIPSEKWDGLSVRVVGHPAEKIFQTGNSLLWQDKDCKALSPTGRTGKSVQTTCTARPGMSGGPVVLNQQGEFKGCWQPIGILTKRGLNGGFISADERSLNGFVPLDLEKYKRIKKSMDENPCD